MKLEKPEDLRERLTERLEMHQAGRASDPQTNPVKLLAYDISREVEDRTISFRTIEALIKQISDECAIERAQRLGERAGIGREHHLDALFRREVDKGFESFAAFAQTAALGVVLTAHPTFSLSRDIRDVLGAVATEGISDSLRDDLAALPYLPERAPTLLEEHTDAQAALTHIQDAMDGLHARLISVARNAFPNQWKTITPRLLNVYSWVGYDIDGRTDISWGDAIRLRLQEKLAQLSRYVSLVADIKSDALADLHALLRNAEESAAKDLHLFQKDISDPTNLVAAANNLTRQSDNRLINMNRAYELIDAALGQVDDKVAVHLLLLRSRFRAFALGTSRIHFRVNARHVTTAIRRPFGMEETVADSRTLLERAGKVTEAAKPVEFNFASLALERSTAHQQLILTAQISRYIDDQTPIRFLIAETEDPIIPLGMLYLARLYGVDERLDISPLFETRDALSNGGRIVEKMLSVPVYRDYVRKRGVLAVQTGFSDAGRFMGQIPATLAVERLQSHLARTMAKAKDDYGLTDIQTIVFNTHGEGLGRGGHPGTIAERADYVMSPWARLQYEDRDVKLCPETSFQGGDGYMWFQTPKLASATLSGLIATRHSSTDSAKADPFYHGRDFSWDVYRTLRAAQESLYEDENYVTLLGGFGQNLLIPTGSRAAKRKAKTAGPDAFNPRQLRAIPHNAILQQFSSPANVTYGVGRAVNVDQDRFATLLAGSERMQSLFSLVRKDLERTDLTCLSAYGRLFDPGFWVMRALSHAEPRLSHACVIVSESCKDLEWRSQIMDLANRLRLDLFAAQAQFEEARQAPVTRIRLLHALRLAVIMKMLITVTRLPDMAEDETARGTVLTRLQTFQTDTILSDLRERFPSSRDDLEWTKDLSVKSDIVAKSEGFAHIADEVVKPLSRAADLARQVTVAMTHTYDAFG